MDPRSSSKGERPREPCFGGKEVRRDWLRPKKGGILIPFLRGILLVAIRVTFFCVERDGLVCVKVHMTIIIRVENCAL